MLIKSNDNVDAVLREVSGQSKYHQKFIIAIFEILKSKPLHVLIGGYTELTIVEGGGVKKTKRYQLIKPLRKKPIYEIRYGISENAHLRVLFFPFTQGEIECIVLTHAFIKTKKPPFDPTNKYRDQSYALYFSMVNNKVTEE